MPSGTATRTRPAPPRRAALAQRTAAPDMPRLPATTRTRPKSPLWLSGDRGGRVGTCRTTSGAGGEVMVRGPWGGSGGNDAPSLYEAGAALARRGPRTLGPAARYNRLPRGTRFGRPPAAAGAEAGP